MKRNLHDIDKLFREGLEDHLEPAPPGAWDAVNNDLDKKQAIVFREKYLRLRRLAVALVLFIFAGIACMFYVIKTGNKTTGVAQTKFAVDSRNDGAGANNKTTTKKSAITNDEAAALPESGKIKETGGATAAVNEGNNTEAEKAAATSIKTGAGKNEATLADNNKLVVKNKEGEIDPVVEVKEQASVTAIIRKQHTNAISKDEINSAAVLTAKRHLTNGNGYGKINKRQRLRNQGAGTNEEQLIAAAGIKKSANSSFEITNEFTDKQAASKSATIPINNKHKKTDGGNISTASVKNLSAYTEQAPLILSAIDAAAPGPLVVINQAPFLNSIIQNDSLVKAVAAAKKKKVSTHPVSLMVFGSPNHSFRRLEDDNLLAGPGRDKRVAERDERRESSFSAGILVNYGLNKKFILQSGVVFTSTKTSISPKIIYARPDNNGHTRYEFNCSSGYSYISPKTGTTPAIGDSVGVMSSSATINYIGIPISINYVFQKGRLLIKPGIGVSINFLTSSNATTNLGNWAGNKQAIASIRGLRTAYLDASVGLGAEFMISKRIAIGVKPSLRMALTSINKNTPVRAYQNFVSLETGLKINL